MTRSRLSIAAVAALTALTALLGSGCSSGTAGNGSHNDGGGTSTTYTPDTTGTTDPAPDNSTPAAPMAVVDLGQGAGAAAAPIPGAAGSQVTQKMVDQFAATVGYETLIDADIPLYNIVEANGENRAYNWGWAACEAVAKTHQPQAVASALASIAGFNGTSAEAIVAAAIRTLCPDQNTGYKTYFDKNVQQAQIRIKDDTGANTDEIATGTAAKSVCAFIGQTHQGTLAEYLGNNAILPVGPDYNVLNNVKHTVIDLVMAQCPASDDKLAPNWYVLD